MRALAPICLITGISSGIGENLARSMVHRGWTVVGISRNLEKMYRLQEELGKDHLLIEPCDVTDPEQILAATQSLQARHIIPTLFFLNAGDGWLEAAGTVDVSQHHRIFAVNYFGAIAWVEHWLPVLKDRDATFVGISSLVTVQPTPGAAAYCASKAALRTCFESLDLRYYNTQLRFLCVLPGPVRTAMLKLPDNKKIPFVWSPEKAAIYIIKQTLRQKSRIAFPLFWRLFFRFLTFLPRSVVVKILK